MSYSGIVRGDRKFGNNANTNRNDYNIRPRSSASIKSLSYTKEYDFTFSLGRPTGRLEVIDLIRKSGAIGITEDVKNYFTMITINENNVDNGQVLIQCAKPGIADRIVEKLQKLESPTILRCHSYSNQEVPVKFQFIQPSVNIQRDVVDHFLSGFGKVKEWHARRDNHFRLLTGTYTFIMYADDLKKNPLPYTVFINGIPTSVHYRTRSKLCFTCNKEGHFARECTVGKNSAETGTQESMPGLEGDPVLPTMANVNAGEVKRPPFLPGIRPEEQVSENNGVRNSGRTGTDKVVGNSALVTDWFNHMNTTNNSDAATDAVLPLDEVLQLSEEVKKSSSTEVNKSELGVLPADVVQNEDVTEDKSEPVQEGNEEECVLHVGNEEKKVEDKIVEESAYVGDGKEEKGQGVEEMEEYETVDDDDEEDDDGMEVDPQKRQAPKRGYNTRTRNNKHSKLHGGKHMKTKLYSNIKPGSQVVKVIKLPPNMS